MVFNATFNNILVISLLSVLLVAETGVPAASHRQTLSRNVKENLVIEWKPEKLVYLNKSSDAAEF
jgi:hypothetical protein